MDEEAPKGKRKHPLIYQPPKEEVSVSKRTAMWFDQPLFQSILSSSSSSSSLSSSLSSSTSKRSPSIQATIASALNSRSPLKQEEEESDESEVDEGEEEEEGEEGEEGGEGGEGEEEDSDGGPDRKRRKKDDDFEVVPQSDPVGSDEDNLSDYDSDEIAQALALGQAAVNRSTGKIKWDSVIDNAYNRYTEDKVAGLPSWFVDDEKKHNKPQV